MKIAVLQAQTGIDPEENARDLVRAVEEAAAGGAAMLFTPEMSGLLDQDRARVARLGVFTPSSFRAVKPAFQRVCRPLP